MRKLTRLARMSTWANVACLGGVLVLSLSLRCLELVWRSLKLCAACDLISPGRLTLN